jgi:hypothetical protein
MKQLLGMLSAHWRAEEPIASKMLTLSWGHTLGSLVPVMRTSLPPEWPVYPEVNAM